MSDMEKTIREIMTNGAFSDFVSIEEGTISKEEREEITNELAYPDGSQGSGCQKKVDLIKLAFYYIQGYTTASMSEIFDVTPQTINELKASSKFRTILSALNTEIVSTARTFLSAAGMKAVITLITCMDSRDERTKLKASTEVLDRIGIRTPEQIEILQKGDRFKDMGEEELLAFVKMGMQEIMPKISEGTKHGEQKTTELSEGKTQNT